ncbi:class I SAM-dependent methyltransferase [Aeromicrobium wangtongii]|uniref:class I SAM-dependent methyltransferase n=1 Tax=Aeromicrobium wangtongii TaxID=2969247 RepID=UPI002016F4F2|nr:class I SAM-dependent methyltransferase [Aeromicrobium wangtongii]MCL3816994.1 methyltransferase domain-containing protein [Aeromicrobium wangtongii]
MADGWDRGWVADRVQGLVADPSGWVADPEVPWQGVVETETRLVLAGDHDAAYHGLRETRELSDEQKKELIELINSLYLLDRELEWTNHGILRSFRFWSRGEKVEYLHAANGLAEVLEGIGSEVLIGFGSVLAYVRDQDFIPHDDDLDLIVAFDATEVGSLTEALDLVVVALQKAGCEVWGDLPTHRKASSGSGHVIDVFVGLIEDGRVSWFPSARGGLSVEQVFPGQTVDFLGVPVRMPARPHEYLEVTYGPDWATPIGNWNHPWDRSQYADLLNEPAAVPPLPVAAPDQPPRRPVLMMSGKRILKRAERLCISEGLELPEQVLPHLRRLSVDEFGEFMWSLPNPDFPALSAILPAMAPPSVQQGWTGSSGTPLLAQTTSFVRSVESTYANHTGQSLQGKTILDVGVGYGRLIRLMYRYSNPDQLWGVDAWDRSLQHCRDVGLPANLRQSEVFPVALPVGGTTFDLAYAFSVFTHLSPRAAEAVLDAVRKSMKPGGLFIVTVRPIEFWKHLAPAKGIDPAELRAQHQANGFAYLPHEGIEGESYGDASVVPSFFRRPGWKLVGRDWNAIDPYQAVLVLQAEPIQEVAATPGTRLSRLRRAARRR